MKAEVKSVITYNGMILYGVDMNGNYYDPSLLMKNGDGSLKQSGQVAIIYDDGALTQAKLFDNKEQAWNHIYSVVPSNGIMQ